MAIKQATESLKNLKGADRERVSAALTAIGTRNDTLANVSVAARNLAVPMQSTAENGKSTIMVSNSLKSTAELIAGGRSPAGTVMHEAQHIVDMHGERPKVWQKSYDTERNAFTTQGLVDKATQFYASRMPLWAPGMTAEQMDRAASAAAQEHIQSFVYGCTGSCFWSLNRW